MNKSRVTKRSVIIGGHKTSVSLEDEFWSALKVIAGKRLINLSDLVTAIDKQRQHGNLSSAVRLFVLDFYRSPISGTPADDNLHKMLQAPSPMAP
jgi:predicted DNA-binding ribbon-helix-helix protein